MLIKQKKKKQKKKKKKKTVNQKIEERDENSFVLYILI